MSVAILIMFLIAVRAALPSFIKVRINHALANNLTDYEGSIQDFDLRLITGSYFIEGLVFRKKKASPVQDLVRVSRIQIDLSWRALIHGRILLDTKVTDATVELSDNTNPKLRQTGIEEKNWRKALNSMVPFDLQSLQLVNCTFHFLKEDAQPKVKVVVDHINGEVQDIGNLRRLRDTEMPTTFFIMSRVQNHARLLVSGQGSFLRQPLAVVVNTDLQDLQLKTLNDLFRAYAWFDVTSGVLSVTGTSKVKWPSMDLDLFPTLQNVDVVAPKQNFKGARGLVTELGVALGNLITRDLPTKTVKTELRIRGDWPHLKLDTWRAVKGLLETRKEERNFNKNTAKNQGV